MKKITVGILAHVDSGKTTLSEGLLYTSGTIRIYGRVDNKNTFLDTDKIEKERGITIFSKQAVITFEDTEITLIDTPGHIDFSAETERTLGILDYAILVISGTDGVQSHTLTLWNLLKENNIPTFIFVNKMDISLYTKDSLSENLKNKLSESIIDFSGSLTDDDFFEALALCDEHLLQKFLETGSLETNDIKQAISNRKIAPCFFGSALKLDGILDFLKLISNYTDIPKKESKFSAKVFKITEDDGKNRLTHLKITGGTLSVKDLLQYFDENEALCEEKINSIRIYQGEKFKVTDQAEQGTVCTVLGLSKTFSGQGLGTEKNFLSSSSEPVFSYAIKINDNTPIQIAFSRLKKLEQEETKLNISYNEITKEITANLMGEIQGEILKKIIFKRFNLDIDFVEGSIIYKETVSDIVEGIGHFEPLRHYAEVHLLIEPLKRGEGIKLCSSVSEDRLGKNWQRLILTHLAEKKHTGVLTNSQLTDVKITLADGKAHLKHTEGGDFRQATYRAVRNALMNAQNILLEPYYNFTIEVPAENIGRIMTDIEKMGGTFTPPVHKEEYSYLSGCASVKNLQEYQKEITVFTKGKGKISLRFKGYEPCKNQEEIVSDISYNPEHDTENTADSVFCSHGESFIVKWNEVKNYMHLESVLERKGNPVMNAVKTPSKIVATEDELIDIFERTYGKIERKLNYKLKTQKNISETKYVAKQKQYENYYVLVDGYNIIFAWNELKELANSNLDHARYTLINKLSTYKMIKDVNVILVFDAYKLKGSNREVEKINNISVVYTKEAETADAYIEKVTKELSKNNHVRVATSDGLEQLIILGNGALRVPASSFIEELKNAEAELSELIKDINKKD